MRLISVKLANRKYKVKEQEEEGEMCSALEVSIHVILVSFNSIMLKCFCHKYHLNKNINLNIPLTMFS